MPRTVPTPPGAMQRLPQIKAANEALLSALAAHPAFQVQQLQRSGKVYFMHDFAQRTDAMFDSILGNTTPTMTQAQQDELKGDAMGRCMMLQMMIADTSGKTGMMFGEAPGQGVDLGDAVKSAAKNVVDVIEGNATGGS